ncbi:MAG: GDP-mannose 4,6-dehydratase [bacterium]|nr:GDP-mannose 4,6-dehydratase [bacterium]MDZ4285027.1 GDP-mannose 4,6-dehydratase [Patescibacteria group bacterium]
MSTVRPRMLITGGAGFIGSNAARFFAARGWDVSVLDNLSRRGVEHNLRALGEELGGHMRFLRADVRSDQGILDEEAASHDALLHFAGQVAVTTSVADPRTDFETNALGTFNVLEAVRRAPTPPIFIYSSTNKVYGALEELSISEDESRYSLADFPHGVSERQQLDFHSPYGCSKGAADKYVRDYARIYGLPTVVFRQSCIYGPHQFGIEDQGWLAWFAIAGLLGRPVTIYGTGKQVRDVLHIEDLMALYERAIERIAAARGQAFNVGGGAANTRSLIEFFSELERGHTLTLRPSRSVERPGDQRVYVSDNRKAREVLGWEPQVGATEGIGSLIGWVRENLPMIATLY